MHVSSTLSLLLTAWLGRALLIAPEQLEDLTRCLGNSSPDKGCLHRGHSCLHSVAEPAWSLCVCVFMFCCRTAVCICMGIQNSNLED